jgi:phage terminase large subunit GpA-like protein
VGRTEVLLNIIGYFIDYDPAPMMLVQPTLELAQAFSKDRLAPMLRDTPALQNKVHDSKSRDSGNTMLHKTFPGGHITMAGANSPASLASRPIRVVLCDEVDRYPVSAGTEGDPVSLVTKRTTTFWNRKRVLVSTPTIKGASRIEAAYNESTMEQWHLPCPSCGDYQPLTWRQIRFEDATHVCRHCGALHSEIEWKSGIGKWVAQHPGRKVRGFHLNELASPWKRWSTIIEEFKEAKRGGPEMLKVWVNTSLGETWEEEGEGVEKDVLLKRREHYSAEVPDDVLVLTAAVDVQDNRLEYEVLGWGVGKESWAIKYGVIMGDPGKDFVWRQLDALVVNKAFVRADKHQMQVMTTCIDSGGHFTDEVYRYCKAREFKRVWAIKGQGGSGISFINHPTKRNKAGVWLFSIGVDVGKDTVASRLTVHDPGSAGYCHFPINPDRGYDEAYFEGLTSEHRVTHYTRGQPTISWKKRTSSARNEPFDLRVYNTAALEILNPPMDELKKLRERPPKPTETAGKPAGPTKRRAGVISRGIQL